jgi:hypothetical protein
MTFEAEWKLKPQLSGYSKIEFPDKKIGTPYYEMILLCDNDYPMALLHIDTFWTRHGKDAIYHALIKGEDITIKVKLDIVNEGGE